AETEVFELRHVQRIAAVMTLTISDRHDQRLRFAEDVENALRDVAILAFVAAADVVRVTAHAALDEEVDGGAVIGDEQPITNVPAVAIQRQGLIVDRVRDKERNELFRILPRAEVVRSA